MILEVCFEVCDKCISIVLLHCSLNEKKCFISLTLLPFFDNFYLYLLNPTVTNARRIGNFYWIMLNIKMKM